VPQHSALLFDLGGTHLRCACLISHQTITNITRERIRSFRDGLSPLEIWQELVAKIAGYAARSSHLVARTAPVVISFPGPLQEDGSIVNAPTISGKAGKIPGFVHELSARTGRVVHLLNDVSAAALYLAERSPWRRLMVLTVSSGIGSKICFRGSGSLVIFDKGPYAGEIGHLTVDSSDDAPMCDCGGKGHLGAVASGRGIELLARQRAASDPAGFSESHCHRNLGATALTLSNEEHFVPSVRAGDRWSLEVLREGTRSLAFVLNAVFLALGLEGVFVIGGFAFSIGEMYLDLLRELIQTRSDYLPLCFSPEMVRFGDMCEEACLRGAAEFARVLE
jgi:C7-cyclitol 7-kinase